MPGVTEGPAAGLAISVVIPTLNEQPAVAAVLENTRGARVERIVVDGGSRDGTAEAARGAGAEQLLRSAPGRARQLEAGFRAAKGDVVLFLHADTRLDPGWADALRRGLEDPAAAGGAFRLRFDSPRVSLRWVEFWAHVRCRLAGLPYGDQGLFVRRAVLEAAGGIPTVPIFEDLDLARTIRRAGRLVLLPERAWTSARRYEQHGVFRLVLRNSVAVLAFAFGLDRERVARWYRGRRSG